ncbi:dihydrolipoyl dehydrogenase family protein [Salipaludibacillus aurantiacus]|uniref:Pyruvate/2-oxoglutarate dehydrogenase complex, dihydrolipoamide dehydrogenase (E3) component n=1 Tax=Salipaludibacillus aurantiacus TaxID=1601833 RepID=A0A1H9W4M5_9BACI|nr:FAD-dependent oxidoreductase [Salipaludibacillus aurantiacus]SES28711.1 Pyruvate/2-oxoglutarate dehydrogenase complex, dihydrolipoamide dehydrogenase (E3) component [Salipaludibacillus aurantiacus]
MTSYDLIVLGGGAGGLTAAAGASSLGAKVALIEKDEQPGGDCLHFGCVPSKALIKVANDIYKAGRLEEYGFSRSGHVKMDKINERIKHAISSIQEHDSIERFEKMGVDVYTGFGSFVSKNEIAIDQKVTIKGKRIVIATGSRPMVPQIEGLKESGFLTNKTIFNLTKFPSRLAVAGGGPIGVELAQAFARLGSDVTLIEREPRLYGKEDSDAAELAQSLLEKELNLRFNASVKKVEQHNTEKKITLEYKDGSAESIFADHILIATGRVPNSDNLFLEKAGVKTDNRGMIKVNGHMQTNIPTIYAVGDVNGALPFTHVASSEGQLVVQNAVLGLKRKMDYANMPWVIYTDPEVFHLGETEDELKSRQAIYHVYKTPLNEVDRFVADHHTDGFVKILTDRKGYILGAHAVGEGAGDFMQEVVFAKQQKLKIGSLSQVVHPYPNHAAAVQITSNSYWREKLFKGIVPKILKRYISIFR